MGSKALNTIFEISRIGSGASSGKVELRHSAASKRPAFVLYFAGFSARCYMELVKRR
ncbi:hypothetical protein CLOSTMETH_03680 [[Clostridium] methylpentosum DSM 5476]|uniref:Uncharacterized protein n=1 Tax=[Clostridium] methylpentosum DSM 5476 TaxID=537013 RepID=C0EII5_9FIRM|nr:hypothetical protein CLOSTMETH_03680 [[Clostridium] methylpentosum DSM 5476]